MNNAINKIKVFFKSKPVRIVVALIIIAAVMTGVGFGVIALVNALKAPCKSGYQYDKDLKVCVKDGCKNICKADVGTHKKGDCMPDDYCDYTELGIKYKFDPDSCKCFGICSSDNEIAKTENGDDTTSMRKTESGWDPVNRLECGYKCKFNKAGICLNKDDYCAISINKNGEIIPEIPGTKGAPDKISCVNLSNSYIEKCSSDENIICDNRTYKCSISEDIITVSNYEYSTNTYCNNINKCGYLDSKQEIICRKGTNDCGAGNCQPHDLFSEKGIYQLGICDNKNDFYDHDEKCNNPNYVGEKKLSTNAAKTSSWRDVAYPTDSGYEGISLNQPQCNAVSNPRCLKRDPKAPWFCLSGDLKSCNYGKPPGTSCEEIPPLSSISEAEGHWNSPKYTPNCCDKNKLSTLGNESFCCPLNVIQQGTSDKDFLCLNKSKYVSDSSWVKLDKKTCSTNVDCQTLENRKRLYDKLKIGMPSHKLPQFSNKEDSNYSDLYCDSGKCKFFAGYVDKVITNTQKKDQNGVKYDALWLVGDDDNSSTSEAVYIGNDTGFVPPVLPYNVNQNLNLCRNSDINGKFGIYDLYGNAVQQTKDHYYSELYVQKQPKGKKSVPVTTLECLNYAKNNLSDAYWRSHINDDGSSAQTGNIKKQGADTCIFTADCGASNFETSVIDNKFLKWNFGPDDVRQLPNKEIILNDAIKTKVKFATHPQGSLRQGCKSYLPNECTSEIPRAWSGLEKNFENVCKVDRGNQCNDNPNKIKYTLKPTSKEKQYCPNGVILNMNNLECSK